MERTYSLGRTLLTMAAMAAITVAPLPRVVSPAAACPWPDPPDMEEGTLGEAEDTGEYEEAPTLPDDYTYTLSQAPIIAGAFCNSNFKGIAAFKLETSALDDGQHDGVHATLGAIVWTTHYSSPYDWQAAGSSLPGYSFMTSNNADLSLVIGELKGSCGTVPCIALAFDFDQGNDRAHWLVPLVEASELVHYVAVTERPMPEMIYAVNPCQSDTACDDTYRSRLSDALGDFAQCMKDSVPPISIWNVACFVACAPLLAGTPIAYALCCAACNAGVSAGGIINYVTCENELEAAKENALASYCACLAYKEANCPGMSEVDTHGCP